MSEEVCESKDGRLRLTSGDRNLVKRAIVPSESSSYLLRLHLEINS